MFLDSAGVLDLAPQYPMKLDCLDYGSVDVKRRVIACLMLRQHGQGNTMCILYSYSGGCHNCSSRLGRFGAGVVMYQT